MSRRYTYPGCPMTNYSDNDVLFWLNGMEYKKKRELAEKIVRLCGAKRTEKNREEFAKAIRGLEKEGLIEEYTINGKTAFRITEKGKRFVGEHNIDKHNGYADMTVGALEKKENPFIFDINKEKEKIIKERVMQNYKKREQAENAKLPNSIADEFMWYRNYLGIRDEILNACSQLQFILTSNDAYSLNESEFNDIRKLLKEIGSKEVELRRHFGVEPTA